MELNGDPVLVTGANGLVGRSVVSALVDAGAEVVGCARGPRPEAFKGRGWCRIDLSTCSAAGLPAAVAAVVHLAADTAHGVGRPEDLATQAMDATIAAHASRLRVPVLYASGCSLYRTDVAGPMTEEMPLRGQLTGYLGAKVQGDQLFCGLERACVLRLSCPYGPGATTSIIGRLVLRAAAGQPISVWGTGSREQDFVTARDVARFVLLALEADLVGPYNVACGSPITMARLAEAVAGSFGSTWAHADRPDPEEGRRALFSIERARLAGWTPKDDLAVGIPWMRGKVT